MNLQRYLDKQEVRALNVNALLAAECEGVVREDILNRAIEMLSIRHPVLRAHIIRDGHRHMLFAPSGNRMTLTIMDGNEEALKETVCRGLDPEAAVAEFLLIRGECRSYIGLHMDHSVTNGQSLTRIFAELWQLYTDLANGSEVRVEPSTSLPRPPSEVIEDSGDGSGYANLANYDENFYELRQFRVQMDREGTTRLITASRKGGISVHGIACGAVLVSQRAQGVWSHGPAQMVCMQPVDLSKRLLRAVQPTESTNLHRRHMIIVTLDENSDMLTVGREVNRQLDAAISRRELVAGETYAFLGRQAQNLNIASVSSMGVLPRLNQPAELDITDLLVFGHRAPIPYPGHSVHTYNGRLTVNSLYPSNLFSSDDCLELSGRIYSRLLSFGSDQSRACSVDY